MQHCNACLEDGARAAVNGSGGTNSRRVCKRRRCRSTARRSATSASFGRARGSAPAGERGSYLSGNSKERPGVIFVALQNLREDIERVHNGGQVAELDQVVGQDAVLLAHPVRTTGGAGVRTV